MAGDTRAYGFDKSPIGSKTKVYKLSNGSLIGVSSAQTGIGRAVREWVEAGMKQESLPVPRDKDKFDFDALIVQSNGECIMLNGYWLPSDPVKSEFYAIGSGAEFALTAMALGANAEEAVKMASRFDVWTGPEVVMVSH